MEIWERFLFWSGESMADKLESLLEADEEDWDECFEMLVEGEKEGTDISRDDWEAARQLVGEEIVRRS